MLYWKIRQRKREENAACSRRKIRMMNQKLKIIIYTCFTFIFILFRFQGNHIWLLPAKNSIIQNTLIFISIMFFFRKFFELKLKKYPGSFYVLNGIVSMFFSFFSVMGKYYSAEMKMGIVTLIRQDEGNFFRLLACYLGGCIFFFFLFGGLGTIQRVECMQKLPDNSFLYKLQNFLYGKYCFLKIAIIIILCWLPHLIIRYPGVIVVDGWDMLMQYFGDASFTTKHPIIYSLLLGKFTDFGISLGNSNYGLYLLILLQVAVTVLVLSYTVCTMKNMKMPYWCCTLMLIGSAVVPTMVSINTTAMLDAFYSAAILLLMNELAYYLFEPQLFNCSLKHPLLIILAVFGTFFRYNGIYTVAPVLLVIIGREGYYIWKKKHNIRCAAIIILALMIPLAVGKGGVKYLNYKYDSIYVSGRAMLVVPIQQIARYMVYHDDDVTREEMAAIQKVMVHTPEIYKERYNPYNFDTIKYGFNVNATKEDIFNFLKIWVKLFVRHPVTYIEATVNQTYFLFSPMADNQRYYKDIATYERWTTYDYSGFFTEKKELRKWKNNLFDYYVNFSRLPALGIFVNQAFYSILLLGICLYALYDKNGRLLMLALPLLLTLAIAFVAPANFKHPRYTYPIVYSIWLLLGIFASRTLNVKNPCGELEHENMGEGK